MVYPTDLVHMQRLLRQRLAAFYLRSYQHTAPRLTAEAGLTFSARLIYRGIRRLLLTQTLADGCLLAELLAS